jgi:hypothetical protein
MNWKFYHNIREFSTTLFTFLSLQHEKNNIAKNWFFLIKQKIGSAVPSPCKLVWTILVFFSIDFH